MYIDSHAATPIHDGAEMVRRLRRAGFPPTRRRMAVAVVALGGASIPDTADDLAERALDAGLCLTAEAAAEFLGEFREAGLLDCGPEEAGCDEQVRAGARLLQAMGNPHRLAVLRALTRGERSVGELQRLIGIQQSALSQHLARLRADGLVRARRESVRIYYSLSSDPVVAVMRGLWGM